MQWCRFGRNFDIFSLKRNVVSSLLSVKVKRIDYRCLTRTSNVSMESKAVGNESNDKVKETTKSEATSGDVVKSESQLKKDAKRLEKLEKFKKKKAAQEAEKKTQGEVSVWNGINFFKFPKQK